MSLQQIMDATPIVSWSYFHPGQYIGTAPNYTYLIQKQLHEIELWWKHKKWEETKKLSHVDRQEIIDKINELEGIKFTVKNIED